MHPMHPMLKIETLLRESCADGMFLLEWDGLRYHVVRFSAEEVRRWHDATYPIDIVVTDDRFTRQGEVWAMYGVQTRGQDTNIDLRCP